MSGKQERASVLTTPGIQALADGIFAIAMTLLVLNLEIPAFASISSNQDLISELERLLPKILIFVLSFLLLASFWRIHHRQYHHIRTLDNPLLWINMLWFLMVVFLPFSASLIGEHGHLAVAALVFHANLFLIACCSLANWWYAWQKKHLADSLPKPEVHAEFIISALFLFLASAAMIVCLFSPTWSSLTYLLIAPARLVTKVFSKNRHHQAA